MASEAGARTDANRASASPPASVRKIVVMGVSGSGKSTIGRMLATRLGARFVEADDYHPPASVAKMSRGIPLDDGDRWPWLALLRGELQHGGAGGVVLACSALKRSYRDVLRTAAPARGEPSRDGVPDGVRFVFLDVGRDAIERRVRARSGHFAHAELIESQFATLERPDASEPDVAIVTPGELPAERVVDLIAAALDGGVTDPLDL